MIGNTYKLLLHNQTKVTVTGKRNGKNRTFLITTSDEPLVRRHTWNVSSKGYVTCTCHGFLLHRFLLEPDTSLEVDHVDRNPSNNTRTNLRAVTHAENLRNQTVHTNNKQLCPVKGVYWTGSSWTTEIIRNGVKFGKSGFDTMHEAICYKIRREYELYGDKSPNYRGVLKKLPRSLLLIYFPEIYGKRAQEFIGTPIFNAHYKNSHHKNWHRHVLGVRKVGVPM